MADKKTVCLIDDEKDFTELTSALLGFQGYETRAVNDPTLGLSMIKSMPFDALVIDIMMPEMDGFSLIEAVRDLEDYAACPIFALSAKKLSPDERKFLLTKNVHFVEKPFEPRRLVELLREAFAS